MSGKYLESEVTEHEAEMKAMRERHAQAAYPRSKTEEHEAAMQEMMARDEEEVSAAMQAFETKVAARRLYHEAPNDVFELFLSIFSCNGDQRQKNGGLNVLRLVSKRCMRVAESVATRLTGDISRNTMTGIPRQYTFPISAFKRFQRIEHIRSGWLMSLERCPHGLKSLYIEYGGPLKNLEPLSACNGLENLDIKSAYNISDLAPLQACINLKKLTLSASSVVGEITDLAPLSSMLRLEELDFSFQSIKDISVLSGCKKLTKLKIGFNTGITDLEILCQSPDLEELDINCLTLIKDLTLFEKGFTKLRVLNISYLSVDDLNPLTKLQSLEVLKCDGISLSTSLLPLTRCYGLKYLTCSHTANDLDALRDRRPDLEISLDRQCPTQ